MTESIWPGWQDIGNGLFRNPNGALLQVGPPPVPPAGYRLRLIVCGGRDYTDRMRVQSALQRIHLRPGRPITELVHGACPTGADSIADEWAQSWGIERTPYPANWAAHGRRAGPLRNGVMVATGADGCVAFPGGRGTADCAMRCEAAGIPVWRPYG